MVKYENREDLKAPDVWAFAQYESTSMETMMKKLVSDFKANSINYSFRKDFRGPGDFQAYWKNLYNTIKEHRPVGQLDKAAYFDPMFREKHKNVITDGRFNPHSNYEHFTWMLLEECSICFGQRAAKEVRQNWLIAVYFYFDSG